MRKKLKDVCMFYSGTGFPIQYQGQTKGEYPFYKVGDIANNAIAGKIYLELCNNYISSDVAKMIKGCILPKDTVVFAKIGEALKLNRRAITSCDCLIDNNAMGIAPKSDSLRIQYFYFCMKNLKMQTLAESTTVPSVRKTVLQKYEIEVPSLVEQEEIEKKLTLTQKIIENRRQELSYLDEIIKARFVELFGDPSTNPKGYPVKVLPEIAEYWNGLTYKPEDVSDEGTIVLRSSNIQNATLDFADTVRVSCKIGDKKYVQDNDILMCSRNGSARLVGKVALIKDIEEPMSFGAFMMIIRSDYYPYLMTYFQMPAFRAQITTGATTTINQITGRMLDIVKLPVPDMDVINEFADFVNQVDKSKVAVQKALDETQILFDSLMQKYFG